MDQGLSIGTLIVYGVFYATVTVLTFFSFFGTYILIKYGRGRTLSLVVAVLYTAIFLIFLQRSYSALRVFTN